MYFDTQYDAFCYLESPRKEIMNSDLPALVQAADAGLRSGVDPVMAEVVAFVISASYILLYSSLFN